MTPKTADFPSLTCFVSACLDMTFSASLSLRCQRCQSSALLCPPRELQVDRPALGSKRNARLFDADLLRRDTTSDEVISHHLGISRRQASRQFIAAHVNDFRPNQERAFIPIKRVKDFIEDRPVLEANPPVVDRAIHPMEDDSRLSGDRYI